MRILTARYEMYLERLIDKLPEEKGISFAEFKSFCQFLNTLEDFGIAMRMYTLAEQPISQGAVLSPVFIRVFGIAMRMYTLVEQPVSQGAVLSPVFLRLFGIAMRMYTLAEQPISQGAVLSPVFIRVFGIAMTKILHTENFYIQYRQKIFRAECSSLSKLYTIRVE